MKESRRSGTAYLYNFGLAASTLSGLSRSQIEKKCHALRMRRNNREVYPIPDLRVLPIMLLILLLMI